MPTTKTSPLKTLSLNKGAEIYIVQYEDGKESAALDEIVAMTKNPELSFDWFDAAVLSHQLGNHLAKELKGFTPKKAVAS